MQKHWQAVLVVAIVLAVAYALAKEYGGPRPDRITGEIEPAFYYDLGTVLTVKGEPIDGNILLGGE